ncbi:uncharacterized protein BDZ99DRAFT_61402 [Mytilinidion resinicola]|uniref:Uncharacterized protein n=1 Tax=Mytilinidion resinicola TaxID=574789 RepID=A0A6A6YFK7_9PEZI|nr:uncharacterized protein BDZ99DRAFT_61402 [Mytilinidion resinicola]KAF2807606.1 hypothetical protein BDZ99DRAFT_61402 [Mytilinidion resinicola]
MTPLLRTLLLRRLQTWSHFLDQLSISYTTSNSCFCSSRPKSCPTSLPNTENTSLLGFLEHRGPASTPSSPRKHSFLDHHIDNDVVSAITFRYPNTIRSTLPTYLPHISGTHQISTPQIQEARPTTTKLVLQEFHALSKLNGSRIFVGKQAPRAIPSTTY